MGDDEDQKQKGYSRSIKLIAGLAFSFAALLVIYIFWEEVSLFFSKYFWEPIVEDSGYNLYNTLLYGLVLIAVVFLAPIGLKKIGVKGRDAAIGALPFILVGSFARVLEDMELVEGSSLRPLFISPLIYVMIGVPLVASLFLGRALKRVKSTMLAFGIAALVLLVAIIAGHPEKIDIYIDALWILLVPGIWLMVAVPLTVLKPEIRYLNGLSILILFGQLLDGCATLFGVSVMGYVEKHPFTEALIELDPYLFLLAKILVAIALIYLLDRAEMDDDYKNIFKFAVIMLGLAPGARDTLRITLGS